MLCKNPVSWEFSYFVGEFSKGEYVLYRQRSPKFQRSGPADTLVLREIMVYKEDKSFYLSSELVPPTPWPQASVAPPQDPSGGRPLSLAGWGGGGTFPTKGQKFWYSMDNLYALVISDSLIPPVRGYFPSALLQILREVWSEM